MLPIIGWPAERIKLEKSLLYDQHTLKDSYKYGNVEREFQWDKIKNNIESLIMFEKKATAFGVLNNYRNQNGWAPIADSAHRDIHYREIQDKYGVRRNQAIPFYRRGNLTVPERYGRDGMLVAIIRDSSDYLLVRPATFKGEWIVPAKYVNRLERKDFRKLIFIDRTNQNATSIEQGATSWLIRSMNPITSGVKRPPFYWETPVGIYVVIGKLEKMFYLHDGKNEVAGYAPWASRFSGGAYLHGISLTYPNQTVYEYSWSLGTIPRSHMCVRNATSHAKFIFDWAPVGEALVIIFD
ncbi:MAG: L,D-transpeptidase [Odoribacter sp.]|nr:L,D-transpeptidase [Odoribacter sp.]